MQHTHPGGGLIGLLALAATAIAAPADSGVVTSTWTGGGGDGLWTTDANWSNDPPSGGYPDNGHEGFVYDAVIGPFAVTLDSNITIDNLTLDRAFITGSNTLTARFPTTLTGLAGFNGGGGTFTPQMDVNIDGELRAIDWQVNAGGVNIGTGGAIGEVRLIGSTAGFTFTDVNFLKDGAIFATSGLDAEVTNNGVLRKTGGVGVSPVVARFICNGEIRNTSGGEIRFLQPTGADPEATVVSLNTVTFNLTGDNSTIRFAGARVNTEINGTTNVSALGENSFIEFASQDSVITLNGTMTSSDGFGSVRLSPNVTFSEGTLAMHRTVPFRQDGGTVGTHGAVINDGAYEWRSGVIEADGAGNAFFNRAPEGAPFTTLSGMHRIDSGTFWNEGFVEQRHEIDFGSEDPPAVVVNQATGRWTLFDGADLYGATVVRNEGLIVKAAEGDSFMRDLVNAPNASVRIEGGELLLAELRLEDNSRLALSGDSTVSIVERSVVEPEARITATASGGSENVLRITDLDAGAAGATLVTSSDGGFGRVLAPPGGQLEGVCNVSLACDPAFPFVLDGGVLSASAAQVYNDGDFRWASGEICSTVDREFVNRVQDDTRARTQTSSTGVERTVDGTFRNEGVFWQRHDIRLPSQLDIIVTGPAGIWRISEGSLFANDTFFPHFENQGTFRKDGPLDASVQATFDNRGLVEAIEGELTFDVNVVEQYYPGERELEGGRWTAKGTGRILLLTDPLMRCIGAEAVVRVEGPNAEFVGLDEIDCIRGKVEITGGRQQTQMGEVDVEDEGEIDVGDFILLAGGDPSMFTVDRLTLHAGATANVFGGAVLLALDGVDLPGGHLQGDGGFVTTPLLDNIAGTIAPGAPPSAADGPADTTGRVDIDGDWLQEAGATLEIEVAGLAEGDFDRVVATGAATLGGKLIVTPVSGFETQIDDAWEIVTGASTTGVFAAVRSPVPLDVDVQADRVVITVTGPPCPADLDQSGAIDFGDLLAVLGAWGPKGGPEDLDGDGMVAFGDILVILAGWGPCPA